MVITLFYLSNLARFDLQWCFVANIFGGVTITSLQSMPSIVGVDYFIDSAKLFAQFCQSLIHIIGTVTYMAACSDELEGIAMNILVYDSIGVGDIGKRVGNGRFFILTLGGAAGGCFQIGTAAEPAAFRGIPKNNRGRLYCFSESVCNIIFDRVYIISRIGFHLVNPVNLV